MFVFVIFYLKWELDIVLKILKDQDLNADQGAGVGGVSWIILQETRKAKIGHLTHQVAVDQNITGSQITVHVVHVGQIFHASCNASQHTNELDDCELSII